MWIYEKKLEFPVHIKEPNPKLAQLIISQYGGPDGEAGACLLYTSPSPRDGLLSRMPSSA